jgi:hypothetical protein
MHHPLSLSWQGAWTLQLHRNHFVEKNTNFHLTSWSVWISEFQCTGKKSRARPCQLRPFTPSIISVCKKEGDALWYKKQCEFLVFREFSHTIITKHSLFFAPSFPMQLQTCNNQLKWGGNQGHRWRVVLLMLSTFYSKNWLTEEGGEWFFNRKRGPLQLLGWNCFQQCNNQPASPLISNRTWCHLGKM